jgi:hypothetical protein
MVSWKRGKVVVNCDNPNDPDHQLICPKLSKPSAICKKCKAWQEADRFWGRWFKGGILTDFWPTHRASESETPVAQQGNSMAKEDLPEKDFTIIDDLSHEMPSSFSILKPNVYPFNINEIYRRHPLLSSLTELSFVITPMLVYLLIHAYQDNLKEFIALSEWSFAATVVFGQSLINCVKELLSSSKVRRISVEKVLLWLTFTLIFVFVPTMVVLTLRLISTSPPTWLVVLQMGLFLTSCTVLIAQNIVIAYIRDTPELKKIGDDTRASDDINTS